MVINKKYSAVTVSAGDPSFGHAALKKFNFKLTKDRCKPVTTCCRHPCIIYIWKHNHTPLATSTPRQATQDCTFADGPPVVLVTRDSPRRCFFEHANAWM